MITPDTDIQAIAQAWIDHQIDFFSGKEYEHRDDVVDLSSIIECNPEKSWEAIAIIVHNLENNALSLDGETLEKMIGVLGAGDLEDLLQAHYPALIDRVVSKAASDSLFRKVLQSTWQGDIPDPAWRRIQGVGR